MSARRKAALGSLFIAVLGTWGCSGREPTIVLERDSQPASLLVSPAEIFFRSLGQSLQLEVAVLDRTGRRLGDAALAFSSDRSEVATVSSAGVVTAVGNGDAQITIRSGALTTYVPVRVRQIPARLVKVSGDSQLSNPGARLPVPVRVRATDSLGVAVAGVQVRFTGPPEAGVAEPAVATTEPDGTASTFWTVGTRAGTHVLTVAIDPSGLATSFSATVRADTPAQIHRITADSQQCQVGSAVANPPAVRVTDRYGNSIAGVRVSFAVVAGGGTVTGGVQTTDSLGLAAPVAWRVGRAPGVNRLEVSVAGLEPVVFTALALVGSPASIRVASGDGQLGEIGTVLPLAPAVLVTDQYDNPVPGVSVAFIVTEGGGGVAGTPAVTNQFGVASAQAWRLGPLPGTNRLQAVVDGLPPVEFTALAIAPPAQVIAVAGDQQTAVAGTAVPVSPSVRVTDAFGNPLSGIGVAFVVTRGGGSVAGANQVTNAQGMASVSNWILGTVAGSNSLEAVVTGLPPITFTATGIAGPPASVSVAAGQGQAAVAGTPVPIAPAVLVRDTHGNPVPGVAVSFAIVAGGGTVSPPSAVTDALGIAATESWILGASPGSNILSATVSGSGISGNPVLFTATGVAAATFDIEVRYLASGSSPTASQRAAFDGAAGRLRAVITADLPSVFVTLPAGSCGSNSPSISEAIDDVLILVTLEPIDGPGGVLGSAGPCVIRSAGGLPLLGRMRFDTADLNQLESDGRLGQVILHEMLHVLGVGTLWQLQGWLGNPSYPSSPGVDTYMNGPNAVAGFDAIGGITYSGGLKVPVHNTAVAGQADAHWRESVLLNELMTPFLNSGFNPLSRLTLLSLRDLGYSVDASQADSFSISPALSAPQAEALPPLELVDDVERLPLRVVDGRGTVLRVIYQWRR
jgi:LysM repeat protein